MFKNIALDYRATRAFQICVVFIAALAIQDWLQFSHAGWIGFSLMMIYAGFDSGTSLHRTQHRFWGAMLGLLLSYVLWMIIRIHYEFIFLIVPIVVFMAFFALGKFYVSPTIFTVTLTALGVDYYTLDYYSVDEFFFDYFRATFIALGICVFFEFFLFKKSHLTHKFYFDLQRRLVCQLETLFLIVTKYPIRQSQYLKMSAQLNVIVLEWHAFFITIQHDYQIENHHVNDLDLFNERMEKTYQNIRQLFISGSHSSKHLKIETRAMLDHLFQMSREQNQGEIVCSID